MRRTLALAFGIVAASTHAAQAQQIAGRIIDRRTSTGIEAALVQLLDPYTRAVKQTVTTDAEGAYRMVATQVGVYRVSFGRFGYLTAVTAPLLLARANDTTLNVMLVTDSVLTEVGKSSATAAMSGPYFENRRRANLGTIVTREEIRSREFRDVAALLATVPNTRVTEDPKSHRGQIVLGPQLAGRKECVPGFFVNGARLNGLKGEYTMQAVTWILGVPIGDVWAVEVYDAIKVIPGAYSGDGLGCGTLALWTKAPG